MHYYYRNRAQSTHSEDAH